MTGCYTLGQGYHQARLLWRRENLAEVIEQNKESAERLAKLRHVPAILRFCREKLGLMTGNSYTTYVRLPQGQPLTWVVQAAERRELRRKTWWFPVVGSQPYLGFFEKEDALSFQEELKREGYDTRVGQVDAFSLLGFLSDPIYSSMIDGRSLVDVVDLLIHETVHRTLYVPGESTFNESFADFVAKRGTVRFFEEDPGLEDVTPEDITRHLETARREQAASHVFKGFLEEAKAMLSARYAEAGGVAALSDDNAFLAFRAGLFEQLERDYDARVRPQAQGTWYERAFRATSMNNAVILAYDLYEAKPEPFESALALAGGDLALMVNRLKVCVDKARQTPPDGRAGSDDGAAAAFWNAVATCS